MGNIVLSYYVVFVKVKLKQFLKSLQLNLFLLDILDEPIQVHCPEGDLNKIKKRIGNNFINGKRKDHLFCRKCIQKHLETESSCPLCFTSLDKNSFQLSKFAQRQISRLRIQCPYYLNGCSWQGLIADNHAERVTRPLFIQHSKLFSTDSVNMLLVFVLMWKMDVLKRI